MVSTTRRALGRGSAAAGPPAGPTLRRTLGVAAISVLTITVVMSLLLVATTQYQRNLFNGTTARLENRMSAVSELDAVLRDIDVPAAGMMYQIREEQDAAGRIRTYDQARLRIEAAFTEMDSVPLTDEEEATLQQARSSWRAMDADVLAAPGMHERGEVFPVLEAGDDPFAAAWQHLSDSHDALGALMSLFVDDLRQQMAATERVHGGILPAAITVVVMALLAAACTGRMVHRRVLGPIQTLRASALAMRDSSRGHDVELRRGSVAELADLADTLNQTARFLRDSHDQLHSQAHTDQLTGLANRKAFNEIVGDRIARPGGGQLAALFIDLDDFKIVNDTMGHAAGDELLRVVAQRLGATVRDRELVTRLGGDEFAIVGEVTDEAEAVAVAERALAALQVPISLREGTVEVACSIGVALSGSNVDSGSVDELMHNADQAMYTAKQYGKNRVEVFNLSLYADAQSRSELRREIASALEHDQFELHYQPVIDLHTGDVLGFEALIRWQHPTRGLLAPGEFIALAEDTGDIVGIGAWVIEQACRDRMTQLAGPHADTWVSVNVSGSQLADDDFASNVIDALERHRMPPGAMVLEITEAVAVVNTERAIGVLQQLRQHGVAVALDDFGTGFSSLRYVADLPIDVIKIDRGFVSAADTSGAAALESIVTLGQRLGVRLVAEGIETRQHLDNVRRLGPLSGQGFLFARPMPAAQAATFTGGPDHRSVIAAHLSALEVARH